MSAKSRFVVTIGALVAFTAVAAAALAHSTAPPAAAPSRVASAPMLALAASSTANTVTVVGLGNATGVPDQASLGLGVSATRPNVHDAVAVANDEMGRLLAALHRAGVADKDIQTQTVSIAQQNNCCPQSVIGYTASNQVTVIVHHLVNVSAVVMGAVDAVGNDIQLGGVNIYVGDPSAQIKTARAGAMADANGRAQDWVRLAGHHLGGLIALSEVISVQTGYTCDQCGGARGGGGGLPIQPGQTTFTVTVTATYELLP
jgi:uncharacterized protein YggE